MLAMFLAWSSWFMVWSWYDYHVFHGSNHGHGLIITFCMFFFEKIVCLSFCSQIVAVIYQFMAHLSGFRGIYASKVASQQHWLKNTSGNLIVFFCDNETASSVLTVVSI